ncbi:MAG: hypothetical protein ACQEXQ_09370 [Bacillota bacterium]
MAISKAKKARQKLSQRGLLTPESLRGSWQGVNPSVKRTPTLQEKQTKLNMKHRRNHANYSDDSFYFLKCRYDQKGLFHRSSTLWNSPNLCLQIINNSSMPTNHQPSKFRRPSNDPLYFLQQNKENGPQFSNPIAEIQQNKQISS